MECQKMNHFRAACRNTNHKAVHKVEQELDIYTEKDGQVDTVNINFINSNAKSPGTIAKLKSSSYQNSVNILYKMDTGSNNNILPFCIQ